MRAEYDPLLCARCVFNMISQIKPHISQADIAWYYEYCSTWRETEHARANIPARNLAAGKKYLEAWYVSNCGVQSKREGYVRELIKHMDVHKYGYNGKYSCPKSQNKHCDQHNFVRELMKHIDVDKYSCGGKYSCPKSTKNRCHQMLNITYKFYLSL
ncbi:hypothetical protein LSAT2_031046, partial [Lamellibrachia satsuma]